MGFFGKNWARELDRAEEFLDRGLPVPALEIAERAERKAEPDLSARAAGMVLRSRQALLTSVLAKADAAEAAGDLEDAADWLLSAIEHEQSAIRRSELETRLQGLRNRAFDQDNPWASAEQVSAEQTVTVVAAGDEGAGDVSFEYETLITMLRDEVRALYENQPEEFRQAVVDLHGGRVSSALAVLERLAGESPSDGVIRLELGHSRLFSGEAAAARDDFDAAWEALGDEPLDTADSLLLPALWAEAALAAGDAQQVVERLRPLASPASGHPELCRLHAVGLIDSERLDEAVGYLEEVTALVPEDPELSLLMAQVLVAVGDPDRAIAGLEQAVAPSCAGGGCGKPSVHPPSFRLLARLHLIHGGDRERACELMAIIANAQQGHLGAEDHEILAEYYRATGDLAAAEDAAVVAEQLASAGSGAVARVDAKLSPRHRRVF
jgi:tetratricopeptide (TPR) repeat protein